MKRVFILCLIFTAYTLQTQAQSSDQLIEDLLSTWDKHTAMNHLILENLNKDYLKDTLSSGGRNVGEQFAHMHEVRMLWVSEVIKPASIDLDKELDSKESLNKPYLISTLEDSDKAMRSIFSEYLRQGKSVGEMSATRFIGYLIAHEAHTRGQIVLALKQSGHPSPPRIVFGIWQW